MRPHRRQLTRLPCPWDSPGKNTGMGCHFLLQCMKVKVKSLSRIRLLATPWTVACQAPPSMGFSRQEYWSGVPLPSLCTSRVGSKTMNRNCSGYVSTWIQRTVISTRSKNKLSSTVPSPELSKKGLWTLEITVRNPMNFAHRTSPRPLLNAQWPYICKTLSDALFL